MSRNLLVLAASCAALAVLLLVLGGWPRRDVAAVPRAGGSPAELGRVVDIDAPAEGERPSPGRAAAEDRSPVEVAPGPGPLSGRLIAHDDLGRPRRGRTGSFRLRVRDPGSWRIETIAVSDGRWTAAGPPGGEYDVLGLVIDGRPATLLEPDGLVRGEGELTIRARVSSPATLRVVDATTGAELDHIELAIGAPSVGRRATSAPRVLAEDLTSPIDLEAMTETQRWSPRPSVYWARAPGHAWGSITIDHARGGERLLPLEGGLTLSVSLRGPSHPDLPVLRLRRGAPGGASVLLIEQLPDPGGPTSMTGIAPGSYELSLETRGQPSHVLGRTSLELTNADASVVLDVVQLPSNEPLAFFGRLHASAAWADLDPVLEVRSGRGPWRIASLPLREMSRDASGALLWHAGALPPGRYEVRITACGYRELIEWTERSDTGHDIVIGDPAEVVVRAVHEGGVTPREGIQVTWRHASLPGCSGPAEADPDEPGQYVFRAPAGSLLLFARERSGRTLAHGVEVAVQPGLNHLVVPLVGPSEIHLRLFDGTTHIPWDGLLYAVDVRSVATGAPIETEPPLCRVPGPGEYELCFGPFRGYEPVAAQRVWVGAGETAAVDVFLVSASRL